MIWTAFVIAAGIALGLILVRFLIPVLMLCVIIGGALLLSFAALVICVFGFIGRFAYKLGRASS